MSIPRPPVELEGHCSTIIGNTLYVLSPGGFQSLPLQKHAKWAKEADSVAVTGPACVTTTPNGTDSQAELWVIGGTSSQSDFQGLQMYSFAEKSWHTINTPVPVMQGRQNHSAAWLQDQESILVYAGSQQDAPSWLSSETFLISTQPPYGIQAFTSEAPPANVPILQPWDSGSVVMVGGSLLNTQISIFSPEGGWQFLETALENPLEPSARGTLIDGSDGSKVLEVYDANVSPNTVAQIVLLGAGGTVAYTGENVGNSSTSRRRSPDLTLNNWPPYNNKNAPTAKRSDYSVVQGSNGPAVIAGGNSGAPVALFDQDQNSWVDADKFFNVKHQQPLKPTTTSRHSTTTSLPTASSTSTPTLAAPPTHGLSKHDRMLRTLGIILGVLFGIAVLFIIVLLILRWRKLKKRKQDGWLDEKDHDPQHMSFKDRGTPSFLKETGGAVDEETPHPAPANTPFRTSKNGSHSSLGIITGKFNKRLSNRRLTSNHVQKDSFDSTSRLVKERNATYAAPVETMEMADIEKPPLTRKMTPRTERGDRLATGQYGATLAPKDAQDRNENTARANRNRSSGWSKYFATSAPTGANGLGHIPSAYVKKTVTTSDGSTYSNDRPAIQHTRIPSSTLVPGLSEFRPSVDGQPVSHVAMGSPSFNDSRDDLAKRGSMAAAEGQRGLIVDPTRPRSHSESISSYNRSTMSSARTTSDYYNDSGGSGAVPWTPTGTSFKDHLNNRPPSNAAYDADKRVPSRGKSSHFFPGAGTSYRPPRSPKTSTKTTSSEAAPPPLLPAAVTPAPLRQAAAPAAVAPADDRDSSMTVWPKFPASSADYSKPVEQQQQQQQQIHQQQKMKQQSSVDQAWPVPPKHFGSPSSTAIIQAQQAQAQGGASGGGGDGGGRDSSATVFPRGVPSAYYAGARRPPPQQQQQQQQQGVSRPVLQAQQQQRPQPQPQQQQGVNENLGWLNLGLGNQSQTRL